MSKTTTGETDAPVTIDNPEQASSNFYWTYDTENGVFNLQTTIRGILTFSQIQAHIKAVLETTAHIGQLGGQAKQRGQANIDTTVGAPLPEATALPVQTPASPAPAAVPTSAPAAAPAQPPATQDNTFMVDFLHVDVQDGKKAYKLEGKPWKYPVRIWDEVLVAAGINIGALEPKKYTLAGYKATFVKNDKGYPQKVTKLEKVA